MRAVFELAGATVEFTPKTDSGPYNVLLAVGTLRVAARAGSISGLGVGESPNLDIVLDNNDRQTAQIIGNPLRIPVVITYDDATPFFAGVVSKVQFGRTIIVTLGS